MQISECWGFFSYSLTPAVQHSRTLIKCSRFVELHMLKALLARKCVEVCRPVFVCLLLCLGIQIREADYIREEDNRWNEKEEGDNYAYLMLEPRPSGPTL